MAQEYAIYWGKDGVNGGKLPFYYAGSNGSDADVYFEQYFRTGGSKRINYNNPEFDKLIDEEQRSGDQKKRMAILIRLRPHSHGGRAFAPLCTLADNLRFGCETSSGKACRRERLLTRK